MCLCVCVCVYVFVCVYMCLFTCVCVCVFVSVCEMHSVCGRANCGGLDSLHSRLAEHPQLDGLKARMIN